MMKRPTHVGRWLPAAGTASATAALWAAQTAFPAVATPEQQALRDGERLRILHSELAQETHALQVQTQRKRERLPAQDTAGTEESEVALQRHGHNIQLLRHEIDGPRTPVTAVRPTGHPARSLRLPAASAPPRSAAGSPEAVTGRWWDVYVRPPQPGAVSPESPANAVDVVVVERPARPPP